MKTLKTAYKELALKYHPDKCNAAGKEKFQQIAKGGCNNI